MSERVHRSIMNIKVGMLFYILSLFLAFFSRKVFLDCLGAEFIGLTGMLMNIMSFLSVAELGIGTSIVYFLYKPLQEGNHHKPSFNRSASGVFCFLFIPSNIHVWLHIQL